MLDESCLRYAQAFVTEEDVEVMTSWCGPFTPAAAATATSSPAARIVAAVTSSIAGNCSAVDSSAVGR